MSFHSQVSDCVKVLDKRCHSCVLARGYAHDYNCESCLISPFVALVHNSSYTHDEG